MTRSARTIYVWAVRTKLYLLLKPRPQLASTDEASSEAKTRDQAGEQNSYPGDFVPIQLAKHSRRMAFLC